MTEEIIPENGNKFEYNRNIVITLFVLFSFVSGIIGFSIFNLAMIAGGFGQKFMYTPEPGVTSLILILIGVCIFALFLLSTYIVERIRSE